mgnify:CR=1 FL=1|tara:strand:- start:913 stop:1590 length:678 start_codon:yes stop_codon:yes gene_type:complete
MIKDKKITYTSIDYFKSPVWVINIPDFLPHLNKISDAYIKKGSLLLKSKIKMRDKEMKRKLGDFAFSAHSPSMLGDPQIEEFAHFCGQQSYSYLEWKGFDLSTLDLHFTELWVQEFSKKGGGHHGTHIHYNQHVSGFYFLKCSPRTSYPIFDDPRPGALMAKLPEKNEKQLTYANPSVHHRPQPGTMIIFPSYLSHQFAVDLGLDPFRFIHWNMQCRPKEPDDKQ